MTVMLAERPNAAAPAPRMGTTEKLAYCRAFAESGMLPRQYRQQPANLLYAVEYAESLGLHPMVAITGVHVIEGKPSASSALIASLVRRAGHRLRVTSSDTQAVAQVIRADDPEFVFEVVWTIEKARTAKLTEKEVWKKYPASMLEARATTAVARQACAEALFGILYTPEELGAEVDADGNLVEARFERQAPAQVDQWQQPAPAQQTPPEVVAAALADVPPESLTPAGRDYLHEALAAPDAATVRLIWMDAKAEGARPDYLDQIVMVGREMAAAEADAGADPATGDGNEHPVYTGPAPAAEPVAEALPGAPDDRKAIDVAKLDMVAAGAAVGVSAPEVWQVFVGRFGHGADGATVAELRAVEAELREVAGGQQ